jgi:hypothetical protein
MFISNAAAADCQLQLVVPLLCDKDECCQPGQAATLNLQALNLPMLCSVCCTCADVCRHPQHPSCSAGHSLPERGHVRGGEHTQPAGPQRGLPQCPLELDIQLRQGTASNHTQGMLLCWLQREGCNSHSLWSASVNTLQLACCPMTCSLSYDMLPVMLHACCMWAGKPENLEALQLVCC